MKAKRNEVDALAVRRDVLLQVLWSANSSDEEVTAALRELDEVWANLKRLVGTIYGESGLESSRN
jgi:hypothetical protein